MDIQRANMILRDLTIYHLNEKYEDDYYNGQIAEDFKFESGVVDLKNTKLNNVNGVTRFFRNDDNVVCTVQILLNDRYVNKNTEIFVIRTILHEIAHALHGIAKGCDCHNDAWLTIFEELWEENIEDKDVPDKIYGQYYYGLTDAVQLDILKQQTKRRR